MASINSVIQLIMAIIEKSFICYLHIDIVAVIILMLLMILVCLACGIIEINVDTHGLIGSDFNWTLSRTHEERFVVIQRLRCAAIVRVGNCVCLQSNSLTLVDGNLMTWKKFQLQIQLS